MENPFKNDRGMPLFLLVSMVLHALLFFIVPKITSGMFPDVHPGEQGGLTYVTLVDAPQTQRVRAAVAEAARRPQARPSPQPLPTPKSDGTRQDETVPVRTEVPLQPTPEPVPVEVSSAPRRPKPQPIQEPVLTSPRGDVNVLHSAPSEDADHVDDPAPPASDENDSSPVDGTDRQDVVTAAPEAEIDPEPILPPTGESMLRSFGGSTFPKNAVGLVQGVVTVEVAAIVGADGNLIDAVVLNGSSISVIDNHAENVVRHLIRFRPYDDMYEMRVFITFNSADQDKLHFRYSEFIVSPPTVGRYGIPGGQ